MGSSWEEAHGKEAHGTKLGWRKLRKEAQEAHEAKPDSAGDSNGP